MVISKRQPAVAPATVPTAKTPASAAPRRAAKVAASKTAARPEETAAKPHPTAAKKDKPVRSSFTLPESRIALLGELKKRCLAFGANVKKGELLSAGLQLLNELPETALEAAVLASMRPDRKPGTGKKREK